MRDQLVELINEEYDFIEANLNNPNLDHYNIVGRLNTVIQIKTNYSFGNDVTIYRDLKLMVKHYLLSLENRDYNYDQINLDFIKDNLLYLSNLQKITFLEYLLELLNKQEIDKDYTFFEKEYYKAKLTLCVQNFTLKNTISIFHIIINYNVFTLLAVVLSLIISLSFLFLPAPNWSVVLFHINKEEISSFNFLNTVSNVILWLIGFNDDFKVVPVNLVGVIILVLYKVIFIGLLIDVGFEQIKKKLGL